MTIKAVDRVVLDTNVLLTASDTGRSGYSRARVILDAWPTQGIALYTSGQILREYLAVATRSAEHNGLGLPQHGAVANVRALSGRMRFLAEDQRVHARLVSLLDQTSCTGKQIHDANVVATMLVHGIETVVTSNTDDFARFESLVTVRDL